MRLATFNVENLFRRPVALDQPSWAAGQKQLNDYTRFNGIISKASYSSADKQWLVAFLDRYEMPDRRISAADPFQLNEVRGKLFKVGVERRGAWAPRTFPHLPEIGSAVEAACDHAAVWVDLP